MRRFFSRMKNVGAILLWDIVTAAIILFLLMTVLAFYVDLEYIRFVIMTAYEVVVVLVLVLKYQLIYKRLGKDDVTKRNNRIEFEKLAKSILKSVEGNFVIIHANIDRFKLINEAYGNAVGDKVLRTVHELIDKELVRHEVSGRIMGDDFGILMRFHSMEKLEERLGRLSGQFEDIKDKNGKTYGISMYFGVYVVEDYDEDISIMLDCANLALKKVAMNHLVPIGVYDDGDKEILEREKTLEMKMQKALENGDFIPYLQPKYELEAETVAGAEALVRWIDKDEGMIYPGEFIPLFEANGFVVDIDLYMFEEVCKLVEKWNKEGRKKITVSVNLSRSHFAIPNFFSSYEKILSKYDIPPGTIEVELTESLFYNDMKSLNELVSRIHTAGLLCSIDDFGSGYSSLNMLKDVNVDALKLDRVFFEQTDNDERGKNIVKSVIDLAQALELHTISEGVEDRSQVEYLKEMNCDLIQGFVFARPMPVSEFEKLAF